MDGGRRLTIDEYIESLNLMFKSLMQNGMSYNDIMQADYYHLMEILSASESQKEEEKENEIIPLESFVKSLGG